MSVIVIIIYTYILTAIFV